MKRDIFSFLFLSVFSFCIHANAQTPKKTVPTHEQVFWSKMSMPKQKTMTEDMLMFGRSFIGNKYPQPNYAPTKSDGTVRLQPYAQEVLVTNLRIFDCVTFVESLIALVQTHKEAKPNFSMYKNNLKAVRYRNGQIDYAEKLHYFTDWIYENQKKGVISDVTKSINGAQRFDKAVFYMTLKKDTFYGNMSDPRTYNRIKVIEQEVSAREKWYIPKENIAAIESQLREGDILAITNKTEGMDMAHVGIVVWQNGRAYMLHASSKYKIVMITEEPLVDYLLNNKSQSGIMVLRLNEK